MRPGWRTLRVRRCSAFARPIGLRPTSTYSSPRCGGWVSVRSRSQSLQALATQAAGELESGEGRSLLVGEHQDVAPAGGRVRPAEEAAPTPCALPRRPGLGRLGGLRTATRVVGHAASLASVRRGILRGLRLQMVPRQESNLRHTLRSAADEWALGTDWMHQALIAIRLRMGQ